jgi:hypothetical protein
MRDRATVSAGRKTGRWIPARLTLSLLGLLVSSLGLVSCFSAYGKRPFVMPPPTPVVAKTLPKPRIETPPDIETVVLDVAAPLITLAAPEEVEPPAPVETQVPKPAPRKNRVPAAPEAEPTPAPTVPTPVPATPQLTEILTDDRRRQYETDFSESISRAQAAVSRAVGRKLSARQQQTVDRIEMFLKQAEDSKGKDLVTAMALAHRADLLARELQRSLP